jgi:hypothetical protein
LIRVVPKNMNMVDMVELEAKLVEKLEEMFEKAF